jgi:hypothetical protein
VQTPVINSYQCAHDRLVLIISELAIISVTQVARQCLAKIAIEFEAFAVSSLVPLVVLLIALLAPVRRAIAISPLKCLRSE